MLSYNGFSSNERAKVGRMQFIAIRDGTFPAPKKCELCLQLTGQMQLHNEDYSTVFEDAHSICRSCHGALHIRFSNPDRWQARKVMIRQLRAQAGIVDDSGLLWWEQLLLESIDIDHLNNL